MELLYQFFLNALILLYQYLPGQDFGVAVIVLTILIKLALYPLSARGIRAQRALAQLQPKIKEIQKKFKNDREKQARAMMELYKKEGVNPFFGFLPLLIQIPILIAFFQVFWRGFGEEQLVFLYNFVPHPGQVNTTFLGIINLAEPSIILAIIIGIVQFFQTKMTMPSQGAGRGRLDFSQLIQKQMLYFFPIFTVFILCFLPAALALYWLVMTLFTIAQQYIIFKKI